MEALNFHDGNIYNLLESRYIDGRRDVNHNFQMHSSLIRRLSQEKELEVMNGSNTPLNGSAGGINTPIDASQVILV